MKNKIFTLFVLFMAFQTAKSQLTLEQTYNHSLTATRINETDYKYYLMDVGKSECRIYNPDHTLWKTIPISLPKDYYLYDIKFVTQNLFNTDSNIELWYSAYNWVTAGSDGYYRYVSKVIGETGQTLANIENGVYAYLIKTGDNAYKLSVYAYDNSFWPGAVKTYIYAVPGTATAALQTKSARLDPYPNPAGESIVLPFDVEPVSGTLQVFSLSGQLKVEQQIFNQPFYRLNTNGWLPGVYLYRFVGPQGVSEPKKFVVQ